jgi:hypothetical protein
MLQLTQANLSGILERSLKELKPKEVEDEQRKEENKG